MGTEQKFRPLEKGSRVLGWACIFAASLWWLVFIAGKFSFRANLAGMLAGMIGFLFVLSAKRCGDESFSFSEYLKRNVRGYYKVFWWKRIAPSESRLQTVRKNSMYVERRKLRALLTMKRSHSFIVAIPFGGWFAGPKMVCDWANIERRWRIKKRPGFNSRRDPDFPNLWLHDGNGSKIAVPSVLAIADLADFGKSSLYNALLHLLRQSNNLRESEEKCASVLEILCSAVQRIEETKRFRHSKEGARIREWLTRELIGLLPEHDPRKAELRAKLDSETAKAGT